MDPMLTIALAGGPIKTIPAVARASAKAAFSLRKPYLRVDEQECIFETPYSTYPGCTAYSSQE